MFHPFLNRLGHTEQVASVVLKNRLDWVYDTIMPSRGAHTKPGQTSGASILFPSNVLRPPTRLARTHEPHGHPRLTAHRLAHHCLWPTAAYCGRVVLARTGRDFKFPPSFHATLGAGPPCFARFQISPHRYIRATKQFMKWKRGFSNKLSNEKLTERAAPRQLVPDSTGSTVAVTKRRIGGVEIQFVADLNIPQHIVNVVRNP